MLDLDNIAAVKTAALVIGNSLETCHHYIRGRRNIPSVTIAKQRLESIAAAATKLVQLLKREKSLHLLIETPMRNTSEREEMPSSSTRLISELEQLAANARLHAVDDALFSRTRLHIRKVKEADVETTIPSKLLWPALFDVWETFTRKPPSYAEDGPTHRFIGFVHRIAELPPPKRGTLKDAIEAWQDDKAGPADLSS